MLLDLRRPVASFVQCPVSVSGQDHAFEKNIQGAVNCCGLACPSGKCFLSILYLVLGFSPGVFKILFSKTDTDQQYLI